MNIQQLQKVKTQTLNAFTIYMSADVLLTTDIKFLKGCHKIDLKVEVKNPVEFVMEVFGYDESNNENSKDQIRRLGTMLLKNIL